MPKNGTKYALVLVFFVGVTVCVCVWMSVVLSVQVNIGYTN